MVVGVTLEAVGRSIETLAYERDTALISVLKKQAMNKPVRTDLAAQ